MSAPSLPEPSSEVVVYRREGSRRLEPDELRVLKEASRERWSDGVALFGWWILFGGLLCLAYGALDFTPGWVRGVALVAALIGVHLANLVGRNLGLRRPLHEEFKQGEVLRFVASPNENATTRSLELLMVARRVWRMNDGSPLPPHAAWPFPASVRLEGLFEIGMRLLDEEERALLPQRGRKELIRWLAFVIAYLGVSVALGYFMATGGLEAQRFVRSFLTVGIVLPSFLGLPERISPDRLRAARATALDAEEGVVWLFRQRDPLALNNILEPITTAEVLPRSGLLWRGPYRDTRPALARRRVREAI